MHGGTQCQGPDYAIHWRHPNQLGTLVTGLQPRQSTRIDPDMILERMAGTRAQAVIVWQRARGQFVRLPATARVMLGLFLLAALLMALHTAFSGKDASLRLKVQHSLRSAQLSVWVDGDLTYSESLVGITKRKFGLIPEVQGSLSKTLLVTPGTHQIKVQIDSDGNLWENAISGDFVHDRQRTLSVNANRTNVSLNWQATAAAGSESSPSGNVWFSRYAGTLMMTVAGSIISALTGFALKELPKQTVFRQGAAPKAGSD
jgi:hypothetical protein